MLLAEIHGKRLDTARDSEDYLTSAVFGHLRYVPPAYFWGELFAEAKSVPVEATLRGTHADNGIDLSQYAELHVHFWPRHSTHGEPDLALGSVDESLGVIVGYRPPDSHGRFYAPRPDQPHLA